MKTPRVSTYLTELREHLATFGARCRGARWFGALFHVRVAEEIVADVAKVEAVIADDAYSAEQADIEAANLLEEAARDGLKSCDMPAIARAIRLIRRSAKKDRDIANAMGA